MPSITKPKLNHIAISMRLECVEVTSFSIYQCSAYLKKWSKKSRWLLHTAPAHPICRYNYKKVHTKRTHQRRRWMQMRHERKRCVRTPNDFRPSYPPPPSSRWKVHCIDMVFGWLDWFQLWKFPWRRVKRTQLLVFHKWRELSIVLAPTKVIQINLPARIDSKVVSFHRGF